MPNKKAKSYDDFNKEWLIATKISYYSKYDMLYKESINNSLKIHLFKKIKNMNIYIKPLS